MNKFLYAIRFIEIDYPDTLIYFFETNKKADLDFNIGLPSFIADNVVKEDIQRLFEKYELHSNYLVNYWPTFCIISIIFAVAMIS